MEHIMERPIVNIGQIKLGWTLGGLMIMIAVVALPLTWYVHRVREIDRQRLLAEQRTAYAQEQVKQITKLIDEQAKGEQDRRSGEAARAAVPPAETVERPR
jgi:hypothetical protein